MKTRSHSELGSVEKSFVLLRLLASESKRGLGLTSLAKLSGLPHPTVHRLLQKLIAERIVFQIESDKRYVLGSLAFELGLAASRFYDLREFCRDTLINLANEVEDTVYLTVRSGYEAVCLDRYEGPSPIRVFTLEVGSRRPLGVGAGGLAILAFLPKEELLEVVQSLKENPCSLDLVGKHFIRDLLESILATQKNRYALIRQRVNLGVSAIGIPILDSFLRPIAAVSVAAVDSRMPSARVKSLMLALQRAASDIQGVLKGR